VWVEGTSSHPFHLASAGGLIVTTQTADPSLIVPYAASTAFDGASIEFEPRSIHVLPDGSRLVACGKHGVILLVSKTGRVIRQYSAADIAGLQRPFDAAPTADGGMLIVDRSDVQGEGRVIVVDANLDIVWQYGGPGATMGADEVFDPFTAEQLPGGHTLITDSLGDRVIEVDDATGAIVWSYGEFKVPGSGAGHLDRPHSAQMLSNGHVLICDSENQRIIEVDRAKKVVWTYGTGVAGSGTGQVKNPNAANRLANGHTLICDSDNSRVLEVDASGHIVRIYGAGANTPAGGGLSDPRVAIRLADGTILIADLGNTRLALYGVTAHREYTATSKTIDPMPAARKRFVSITVGASVPDGAHVSVEYSINSGAWTDLVGTRLPSDAIGTNVRYRLRLTTGLADASPVVRDVSIDWVIAGASGSNATTGTGTTGSHTTTTTTGSGSGSQTATSAAAGGSTSIPGGTLGGSTGTGGQAVSLSSSVSGWVMSEVKDDVLDSGTSGSSGTGYGGRPSSDSTIPGATALLAVYVLGIAWTPTSRFTSSLTRSLLARIATTTAPR
jgi:hypothetical protein